MSRLNRLKKSNKNKKGNQSIKSNGYFDFKSVEKRYIAMLIIALAELIATNTAVNLWVRAVVQLAVVIFLIVVFIKTLKK